jgi:glucose-6-phosphate isomerase
LSSKTCPRNFAATLERAQKELAGLLADARAAWLHPLTIADETLDLMPAQALAERLKREASHVVILGIGGSSLGAQALSQIKDYYTPASFLPVDGPRLHFLDNPDAETMSRLLRSFSAGRTHYIMISKSGGTAETMMQGLAVLSHLEHHGQKQNIAQLMTVVSEPRDNPLTRLARAHEIPVLDHPTDIGGRFSVLSVVGLLPAMVMGVDAKAIRAGAAQVWHGAAEGTWDAPVRGAAFSAAAAEAGLNVQVVMPYADRLDRFAAWYRQLWAESLGKNGKGTLPVRALGPVDQHSQLQFYLGGTPLAAYTVLTVDQSGQGPHVPAKAVSDSALGYLKDRHLGDLVMAEARATYETFEAHGRPCRRISVEKLDEQALGALFAHFMIETILTARLIGVDAFDQPAVEEGKVLARRYLQEMQS